MHLLDLRNVVKFERILRRRLDHQSPGTRHPVQQSVLELDAVNPGKRNVDTCPAQHPVAIHHPPVGDHEMRRLPGEERPSVNQITSTSQMAAITAETTCRARGSQSMRLTVAAPNAATAVQTRSASTGAISLSMRMPMQHHLLIPARTLSG